MEQKAYCLSDANLQRLQRMAANRRKEPGMQLRVSRKVYDRLMEMIPNRDKRRPFIDKALTDAMDNISAHDQAMIGDLLTKALR